MTRRVVVTGVGVISALGNDRHSFAEALREGETGIGPLEGIDPDRLRFRNVGQVRGYEPSEHFDRRGLLTLARFGQFSVVTAREAVEDSGIDFSDEALALKTGAITGCGAGGLSTMDQFYIDFYCEGKDRFPPTVVPRAMPNAGASNISMEFGLGGPTFTTSTACSSSNHAIGQAFHLIRSGVLDAALTGGAETTIELGNLRTWDCMRVVSTDTCRPFSKDRSGMILGEGAATIVLEEYEHAKARGADIYCELVGFGMSADAGHITKPSVAGASRAIESALSDSGLDKSEIEYVNAHGTGTGANDPMETEAIRTVFGEHADNLAVSSTKSLHGHALGASGALEAAATAVAFKEGFIPPTANYNEPDPECDLDYVPNESRNTEIHAAVSNSFAFGGLNAVLVFKKV